MGGGGACLRWVELIARMVSNPESTEAPPTDLERAWCGGSAVVGSGVVGWRARPRGRACFASEAATTRELRHDARAPPVFYTYYCVACVVCLCVRVLCPVSCALFLSSASTCGFYIASSFLVLMLYYSGPGWPKPLCRDAKPRCVRKPKPALKRRAAARGLLRLALEIGM